MNDLVQIKNLIYTIRFYSDNSLARLSSKFLLKYEENNKHYKINSLLI